RYQAADRQDTAAPRPTVGARSVEQADRSGADGCNPVRRQTARAHDRSRDEAARPAPINSGTFRPGIHLSLVTPTTARRSCAPAGGSIVMSPVPASSNVRALEQVRILHHSGKPDRTEVEAA